MRYLLAIITVAGLWLAMGMATAATTNVTPVVVNPAVGFDTWMRAGDRLAMPTTTGGFTAVLDPGAQSANAVFSYPVIVGSDTLAVLGLPQHFTAKITFNASTTSAGSINVPAGTAPSVPADGDIWETTAGLFLRVSGVTIGPVGAGGGSGVITVNTRNGVVTLTGTDIPSFVASGSSHAPGAVPDPGASAGTTKFLREDATWAIPAAVSGVSSVNTRTGAVTLVGTDIPVFVASGGSHAPGAVPDPGVTSGSTRFLREDATFAVPSGALPAGLSAPSPIFAPDTLLTLNSNTTTGSPEARAFYPQSVYRLPWSQRVNLQSALDTYGAVRLDAADYTTGVPFGTTITMRTGYRLYGPGVVCTIPMISIAAGSSGVVLSGIHSIGGNQTVTFQAGAQISNCLFRHMTFVNLFQGTSADIEGCTWVACSNCQWAFDCSTGGHFSNNRILGTLSQNTISEIVIKGNPGNPSVGNQIGAHASLSAPAADSIVISNAQNFSAWQLNVERYTMTGTPAFINLASSVTAGRVWSMGGFSAGSTLYNINTPLYWKVFDTTNVSGAASTAYGAASPISSSYSDINEASNTNAASSPDRFSAFDNTAFLVKNNGTNVTGALGGGAASDFASINYPARSEAAWASPTWDVRPASPLGDQWTTLGANLPDASSYIQGLITANGVAVLGPGVYKIVTPIKINDGQGIIGAGMHKTVLLAATTSTDLIVNDQTITGASQHITVTDLTLQGGANGIHHSAAVGAPAQTQFSGMVISHVCFRDMTNAGMFCDQIYGWDNNSISNCDFVSCPYGQRSFATSGANNIAYVDKQNNFHNRYLECGYGVYYTEPFRADNLDVWINCQFANNVTGAFFGDSYDQAGLVNCLFTNNGGNPSVNVTGGDLQVIGCTFTGGPVNNTSMIQSKTLFMADSTFSKGASTSTVVFGTPDSFGNGIQYLSNNTLVDIGAGTSVFQHCQSINNLFGAGDYNSLNVGWAFQLSNGSGFVTAIATSSNPVTQILRGAALPAVLERYQTIDSQGINSPYTPENITAASGGGPFVATGSVTSRTPADRGADRWNVKDFGCIDDGTTSGGGTDNSSALTVAVAAAHSQFLSTGQPVGLWLGKGTYALATTVVWQSGVKLYGPGCLVTKNASTYTGAMHSLIDCSGLTNVCFDDVTGYGVGPDQKIAGPCTDNAALGLRDSFIDMDLTNQVSINNCQFFRFQDAVLVSRCNDTRFTGNYINDLSSKTLAQLDNGTFVPYTFVGDPGAGIRYLGERSGINQTESDGVVCANNVIIVVGLDIAIDLTSQSGYPFRCQVTGNYCAGSNSGIQVYTSGADTPDPGTLTTTDRGVNISANTCQWTYQQGIYIRGVEGVTCTGNHVDRCALIGTFVGSSAGGILCRVTTNATYSVSPVSHDLTVLVSNNQVTDCGNVNTGQLDAGIRADPLRVSILNNQVVRSADRFGANIHAAGSVGILGLDTGTTSAWLLAAVKNNVVRGFETGIAASYVNRTQIAQTFSAALTGNNISNVTTGINVNTSSSGFKILDNTISASATAIYIKNCPYSSIDRNYIQGPVTAGITIDAGSLASDFYSLGGRMGATLTCNNNIIYGATTPINIASTATGDTSVRTRCLTAYGNIVDGNTYFNDSNGSITYTAAPTVSDFRIWHVGDTAPVRAPSSGGPGWVCATAGAFGAAIATTATTTNTSTTVTFSGTTCVVPDDYITIVGVTGNKHVLSVNNATNTCVIDVAADASVSGAAIARPAPVFSNNVPVAQGGTGAVSFTAHGVLTGNGTSAVHVTAVGTTGQVLTGVTGADPVWAAGGGGSVPTGTGFTHITGGTQDGAARAVNVGTVDITGTQAVGNGGTGAITETNHGVLLGQGASAFIATAVGTTGQVLTGVTGGDPIWTTLGASGVSSVNTRTGAVTLLGTDIPAFVASGASHAPGAVPDPGATPGTTKFLREDGSFQVPAGSGTGFPASTSTYIVQDATDNTKQQLWNLASASTGTNLTLKGQQSTSQTLAFPNVTTSDTVATLGVANFFTPPAVTATSYPTSLSYVSPAHTVLTNGVVGLPDVVFDLGATHQWGGNTTITGWKGIDIKAPVLSSTTATTSFVGATTLTIEGGPIAGANASTSGAIALNIVAGNLQVAAGTLTLKGAPSNQIITQSAASSGTAQSFSLTGGAHTNQTASTEVTDVNFNLARTVQHATGALTTDRSFIISGPTHSFVGASTLTEADTAYISQPAAGANANLTNANALRLTGQLLLDPQVSGGAPQDGNLWADSTQQTLSTRSKGLTTPLEGSIFTATATGTCAATTSETSIVGTGIGTKTLSANYLVPGKTIRILIKGIVSNNPGDSLDIKVKAGSGVILDTTAVVVAGTLTNTYFQITATITCRTTGVSGTVMASGNLGYMNGATGQGVSMVNTSTVALDTTVAEPLDVTATWNSANASNSIGGQIVTFDAVN